MFDPMQTNSISAHPPSQGYQNLDEEQSAQRYGHVVVAAGRPLWSRISLRVGKFLIHIGEKLAAENNQIELSKNSL